MVLVGTRAYKRYFRELFESKEFYRTKYELFESINDDISPLPYYTEIVRFIYKNHLTTKNVFSRLLPNDLAKNVCKYNKLNTI